jgi:hypothetical protein
MSGRFQSSAREVATATAVAAAVTSSAHRGARREVRIAQGIGVTDPNLTPTNVHRALKP